MEYEVSMKKTNSARIERWVATWGRKNRQEGSTAKRSKEKEAALSLLPL
jgi:hypothetical protein